MRSRIVKPPRLEIAVPPRSIVVRRPRAPWLALLAMLCAAGARAEPTVPPAPEPPAVPESIVVELESLQAQIDELRAAAAVHEAGGGDDSAKPNKLSPHGEPTLEFGGQMQADTVYFSQDAESIATVGDLQDGSQFRRLRITASGKT